MHKPFSARVAALAAMALLQAGTAAVAHAESLTEFKPSADRGFSYFLGVAQQTSVYSEKPTLVPVRVASKTKSAMLVSGALYAFNDDLLMSLDNHSTFAPTTSMERWHSTAGELLQTDRFSLNMSNTRALAYVRQRSDLFWTGGVNFRSSSFKRYDFNAVSTDIAVDNIPTEESTSEIVAELGLALEGERVKDSTNHYGLRVSLGTPLWRHVTNTSYPGMTFDNRQGWDANVEGRYSWALTSFAHIGLWGRYSFSHRSDQRIGYVESSSGASRTAELPASNLRTTTIGVELLWKL